MEGEKIKVEERDKGGERKDCELPKEHMREDVAREQEPQQN